LLTVTVASCEWSKSPRAAITGVPTTVVTKNPIKDKYKNFFH